MKKNEMFFLYLSCTELKHQYAGVPNTERGRNAVIATDPKTKSKLIYGCGTNVVLRDLKVWTRKRELFF